MAKQQTTEEMFRPPVPQVQSGTDTGGNAFSIPTITADSLSKPPKAAILPPPAPVTNPNQFVERLQPAIQQSNQGLIEANTREAKQREDVLGRLLNVNEPNSQSIYDSKFRGVGGEDYLKQFTDANTRLAQLQGVFNTGSQKVSSAPGQSQVFEGLQLNEVSRQKAVEVGNQALVVQALQGNVETARQIALDTTRFASEDRAAKLQSLIAQFDSLNGIVEGQEKQLIDTARIEAEKEYDQLKRLQATIDTAIQSGGATTEDMKTLIDPNISDERKLQIAQNVIATSAFKDKAFEQDYKTKQLALSAKGYGVVGTDDMGNNVYGFTDLSTGEVKTVNTEAINGQYADGSIGGQCGEFTKNLTTLPTPNGRVGNEWAEKKAFVDTYGISGTAVRAGDVQPGDVLYFDLGTRWGHVATVIGNNEDGTVTVKESNWNNDEKVGTRVVSLGDPKLYGSIRGTLKAGFGTETAGNDLTNAFKSIAPRLTADGRKSAQSTLNQYVQSGDTEGAKQFIMSTAISSLPAEQQNKAFGRLQAIDSLNNIKSLLQEYQSKGGRTDILTGTQEQIAQKLGNTTNPELAGIGNQIALAMAAYRNAISGAAFTESEAKFYEGVFPSTKNSTQLNDAKIDSLLNAFNLNQKSTLQTVLGAKNYDALMAQAGNIPADTGMSPEEQFAQEYASMLNQPSALSSNNLGQSYSNFMKPAVGVLGNAPLIKPITSAVSYIKSLFSR